MLKFTIAYQDTRIMPFSPTKNRSNNVKMYRKVQTTLICLKCTTVCKIYQTSQNVAKHLLKYKKMKNVLIAPWVLDNTKHNKQAKVHKGLVKYIKDWLNTSKRAKVKIQWNVPKMYEIHRNVPKVY